MDLWVVAAAAGAGYLAKYWQKLTSSEHEGSSLVSNSNEILVQQFQANPLRRLALKQVGAEDVLDSRFPDEKRFRTDKETGMPSTGGGGDNEALANRGQYGDDYNVLSLTSLLPVSVKNEGLLEIGEETKRNDLVSDFGLGGVGSFYRFNKNWHLRSRNHGYFVKPLDSLESYHTAQLFKEHAQMEEYVFSSIAAPSTMTTRPLLVTDGRRKISTSSHEFEGDMRLGSSAVKHRGSGNFRDNLRHLGVRKSGLTEVRRNRSQSIGNKSIKLSSSRGRLSGGLFYSQGSTNGMLLFFLGITIGMISIAVVHKKEVDKLNKLMHQNTNLVEDLDKELEMKDLKNVKELNGGSLESLESNKVYDGKESDDCKAENSESVSKIEAELEAELEGLELDMKNSSLGSRYNFNKGEVRPDKLNLPLFGSSDSENETSGSLTDHTHTADYPISPMDLRLRLHKVIQSRLEARITELETELETRQKNVQAIASERRIARRIMNSDSETLSAQESATSQDEVHDFDEPLVMNLSGEALEAYSEAYEELCKMTETNKNAKQHPNRSNGNSKTKLHSHKLLSRDQCGGYVYRGRMPQRDLIGGSWLRNMHDEITTWEEETSRSWVSNGTDGSEDDDEMGKLLIKQIVEKARQRSPGGLNVQRLLFSMDDR